jgi:hypothetical protein
MRALAPPIARRWSRRSAFSRFRAFKEKRGL